MIWCKLGVLTFQGRLKSNTSWVASHSLGGEISNQCFCLLGHFISFFFFAKWCHKDTVNGSHGYNTIHWLCVSIRKILINYFSKVQRRNISSSSLISVHDFFHCYWALNVFYVLRNSKYLKKKWILLCWLRFNLFILKWILFEN